MTRLCALLLLCAVNTFAQAPDKDPVAIVELGGATGTSLTDVASSFGPNVAVEITPIENWLELEMGITPLLRRHHSAEWSIDLLFKKPWKLSEKVEFMAGIGPEWVHTKEAGTIRNSIAFEAAGDFMFWPTARRRFGFFVEPAYDCSFARGHEQSIGISGGLLIAFR